MIVLWISELITEYGLGNGASLLIFTNIVSSLPNLGKSLISENNEYINPGSILLISILLFIAVCGIILLQEGSRIIPLISAKQSSQRTPVYSDLPKNNYIPLRLNQAGVMPIIFTASILVLSNYLQKMAVSIPGIRPGKATTYYLKQVMKRTTFIGAILLALLTTFPNIIETVLHVSSL